MKIKMVPSGLVVAAIASTALNAEIVRMPPRPPTSLDLVPTGKGWGETRPHTPPRYQNPYRRGGGGQYGIYYHNGAIMAGTTAEYFIYYGRWSASQKTILEDFGATIGGSPYFNTNTTYWGANKSVVSNSVRLGATAVDSYSQGTTLSDGAIFAIVQRAIISGDLPRDASGVYFVLTSPDVDKTGFCSAYCGWHADGTINGTDIKYAFVGNTDRCPDNCAAQKGNSPNGDTGVDGAISVLAHELDESVTDPAGSAWYDSFGQENADKCAWSFGATYTAPNGSTANMQMGGRDFLIQQNWTNASGAGCRLAW